MNNIDKIRQEIERRKNEFYKKLPRACYPESCNSKEEERAIGIYGELTDLLSFLDLLSEEKQSEDLEKAANNCIAEFADYVMAENSPEEINLTEKLREIFKAGAEWMAGQGVQDSIEGTICGRVYDHVNVKFPDGIGETLEPKSVSHIPANVKNYNIGDEVIIQIRKKQ